VNCGLGDYEIAQGMKVKAEGLWPACFEHGRRHVELRDERRIPVLPFCFLWPEELAKRLDDRTVDRLVALCLPVKLTGSSYRQKLAAQRASLRNLPSSEVLQ